MTKMKLFVLNRKEDESGVSGTGIVAEGVVLSNGQVVLHWLKEETSAIGIYKSIEAVEAAHGHSGKTEIVFGNTASGFTVGDDVYYHDEEEQK